MEDITWPLMCEAAARCGSSARPSNICIAKGLTPAKTKAHFALMKTPTKSIMLAAAAIAGLMTGCATQKKECPVGKGCAVKKGEKASCGAKADCSSKHTCRGQGNCGAKSACNAKKSS